VSRSRSHTDLVTAPRQASVTGRGITSLQYHWLWTREKRYTTQNRSSRATTTHPEDAEDSETEIGSCNPLLIFRIRCLFSSSTVFFFLCYDARCFSFLVAVDFGRLSSSFHFFLRVCCGGDLRPGYDPTQGGVAFTVPAAARLFQCVERLPERYGSLLLFFFLSFPHCLFPLCFAVGVSGGGWWVALLLLLGVQGHDVITG